MRQQKEAKTYGHVQSYYILYTAICCYAVFGSGLFCRVDCVSLKDC